MKLSYSAMLATVALACCASVASAQTPAPATAAPAAAPAATAPAVVDRTVEQSRIRSERNLKICRPTSDGLSTFTGTVKGRERGKIQVLVTEQIEKASGKPTPNFHETNVWDDPLNWTICP